MFRTYLYVFGSSPSGKKVLLGPFSDKDDAIEAMEDINSPRTFKLKTADQTKAVRIIRNTLRKEGVSVDDVMENQLHGKGLARELGKDGFTPAPKPNDLFSGNPFEE